MRKLFYLVGALVLIAIALFGWFDHRYLWGFALAIPLFLLGIYNMVQSRHTILRNFPVLGYMRYALEFLAPLYPAKALRRYLNAATELQELLGAMNDIAVAEAIMAEQPRLGSDALIRGWFGGRSELLLTQLPHALKIFLAARPPWQEKGGKQRK